MVGLETEQQVGGQHEQRAGGRRGRAAQSRPAGQAHSVRNGPGATVLGFADYGKESKFKGCNEKPLELFFKKKTG